jgi:Dimerisation domain
METAMSNEQPTPDAIMQLTRAYAGSKALVSAVELGLFTTLADGPLTGEVLRAKLGLQPRGATDWLDALVSLGMLEQKLELLGKAYRALPDGRALIVYESLIDDDRRTNTFGLLLSVAMLLGTHDGLGYTGAQCRSWMSDIGFRDSYVEPLVGPDSMVVGLK